MGYSCYTNELSLAQQWTQGKGYTVLLPQAPLRMEGSALCDTVSTSCILHLSPTSLKGKKGNIKIHTLALKDLGVHTCASVYAWLCEVCMHVYVYACKPKVSLGVAPREPCTLVLTGSFPEPRTHWLGLLVNTRYLLLSVPSVLIL